MIQKIIKNMNMMYFKAYSTQFSIALFQIPVSEKLWRANNIK